MIVVSLLLIFVAVALLVLGLGAGSSALLISSIVASLLAAVALVIGARRAATLRATTTYPHDPRAAEYDPARDDEARRDPFPPVTPMPGSAPGFGSADAPDFSAAGPSANTAYSDSFAAAPPESSAFAEAPPESSSFAGAPPESPSFAAATSDSPDIFASGLSASEADASARRDSDPDQPLSPRPEASAPTAAAGSPEASEGELSGSDDDEDPADEPPPQPIRPVDAVRIARMSTDVFVVDGRPRYHLAECPHLRGRQAEPIPADEAMELGFTPCSLCRPVDHLVADSARR
jgi:hypothetical protein